MLNNNTRYCLTWCHYFSEYYYWIKLSQWTVISLCYYMIAKLQFPINLPDVLFCQSRSHIVQICGVIQCFVHSLYNFIYFHDSLFHVQHIIQFSQLQQYLKCYNLSIHGFVIFYISQHISLKFNTQYTASWSL